ncbi:hypothetical protein IPJ70_01380 [Candidatus Campbellbacteria bacterium]|nr:MAG: hypothetical protein IPJ70_01380 [Candidatus Campbellbacteria bacterium]
MIITFKRRLESSFDEQRTKMKNFMEVFSSEKFNEVRMHLEGAEVLLKRRDEDFRNEQDGERVIFNINAAARLLGEIALANIPRAGKQARKPKPAPKAATGQFVHNAVGVKVSSTCMHGEKKGVTTMKNVVDFSEFAEEQREVAARIAAKANAGKKQKEPKKEKGSKSAKKRATA